MKKSLLILLFLSSCFTYSFSQAKQRISTLQFNSDKEFKILQLTDLHWNEVELEENKLNEQLIHYLIKEENPDLVLFTGDVVVDPPLLKGWKALGEIMKQTKKPWVVVLGNHDTEVKNQLSRQELHQYINQLPYIIPSEALDNYNLSSFALPITNYNSNECSHLLYCIDSNDYATNQEMSHYAWIDWQQMNWYKKVSESYKQHSKESNLHALAFFHIPLLEYNEIQGSTTFVGQMNEGPSTATLNSGFFCQLVEQGDVKGVFVGHDHDNDAIGIYQDIALAFGRVTGYGAYGKLNRGGRIIKLYQGEKRFDTWIHDKEVGISNYYYYPSGISKEEEESLCYLPSETDINTTDLLPGLNYSYFEARYQSVKEIHTKDLIAKGVSPDFSLSMAQRPDSFALVFEGFIEIEQEGVYDFYLTSDDGSQLFINQKLIVDNDGSHSTRQRSARIALKAGLHPIKVLYFEDYMGQELIVSYSNKEMEKTPIPTTVLYRKQ